MRRFLSVRTGSWRAFRYGHHNVCLSTVAEGAVAIEIRRSSIECAGLVHRHESNPVVLEMLRVKGRGGRLDQSGSIRTRLLLLLCGQLQCHGCGGFVARGMLLADGRVYRQ